ncbi:MAG: hypothetical protein ACU0GG_04680 [Paracoccaceae bacterium]
MSDPTMVGQDRVGALTSARAQGIFLLILATLALSVASYVAKPFLAPVLFAMVIGVVVAPVADRLNNGFGIPASSLARRSCFLSSASSWSCSS